MNLLKSIFRHLIIRNIRGSYRLYQLVYRTPQFEYKTSTGCILSLDPDETIDFEILRYGEFDTAVIGHLLSRVRPQDVFWDIGSNIGFHSLSVKRYCPEAQVIAIEPYYKNCARLKKNCELNPELPIKIYNFALGSGVQIHPLHVPKWNLGRVSLLALQDAPSPDLFVISVDCDFLVENRYFPQPNIIKMDVEGFELMVLRGSNKLLDNKSLRCVVFESFEHLEECKIIFRKHGFQLSQLDTKGNWAADRN